MSEIRAWWCPLTNRSFRTSNVDKTGSLVGCDERHIPLIEKGSAEPNAYGCFDEFCKQFMRMYLSGPKCEHAIPLVDGRTPLSQPKGDGYQSVAMVKRGTEKAACVELLRQVTKARGYDANITGTILDLCIELEKADI